MSNRDNQNTLYVVRRPLEGFAFVNGKATVLAHSALLLKIDNKYSLVEYMGDSKVYTHSVPADKVQSGTFEFQGYKWTKQENGQRLPPNINERTVANTMTSLTSSEKYSLFNNNCHMAQEGTRKALGLTGNSPLNY